MDKHCIPFCLIFGLALMDDGLMDKHGPVGFIAITVSVLVVSFLIQRYGKEMF